MSIDEENNVDIPEKKKKRIFKNASDFTALYLSNFGRYICSVIVLLFIHAGKNILSFFRYIWDKSVSFRKDIFTKLKYLGIIIISPFVKIWNALVRARDDIIEGKKEKGLWNGIKIAASHLGDFIFGKTGLAVTLFNVAAPVVCVLFFFNIIAYANSLNYAVKLTVNGRFLGYIENEQVYYDAEDILKDRINYLGSEEDIQVEPQYSIELIENQNTLTKYQVADKMLEYSDLSVEYAYGFYLNGVFMGAMFDNTEVKATLDGILNQYKTNYPQAEISFADRIECETAGLYLSGSIIDTDWLISQLTSVKKGAGYYIIEEDDTHEGICKKLGLTMAQLELMNPDFAETELHAGNSIKSREAVPFLSVNVTVEENYDTYVDYDTEYYSDNTLYTGVERVTTEGVNGVNNVTAKVTYVNNFETERDIISSRVTSRPVTERIAQGTKPTPESIYSPDDAGYGKYIWPVDGGHISELTHWDGGYAGHVGVDIVAYYGAAIFAGASGTVTHAGWLGDFGQCVVIDHDNGFQTLYAHCSAIYVVPGQEVTQGEFIAAMGATGYVTGTHLHFEVRHGLTNYNPIDYLEKVYY